MEISPNEVVFTPPYEEVRSTYLRLQNTTNHTLIYKVKTTTPQLYCVRPNASSVAPGKTLEVEITRQGKPYSDSESRDKFLILSTALDTSQLKSNENIAEIWSHIENSGSNAKIDARKLKVQSHPPSSGAGASAGASAGAVAGAAAGSQYNTASGSQYGAGPATGGSAYPGASAASSQGPGHNPQAYEQPAGAYGSSKAPFDSPAKSSTYGDDYAKSGQDYSKSGQDYSKSGQDYSRSAQDYSKSGQDYSKSAQDYSKSAQDDLKSGQGYSQTAKGSESPLSSNKDASSTVSGSGPHGEITVDDLQGVPGVPPKSRLVDEGDALTGPKLAKTGDASNYGYSQQSESQPSSGFGAGNYDSTTRSTAGDRNLGSTSAGSNQPGYLETAGEYAASAKDKASEAAGSALVGAGAAAGAAAGYVSNAAGNVSSWVNSTGADNNAGYSQSPSRGAGAGSDIGSNGQTAGSIKSQTSYAGGFENIVNGGGFEAAPAHGSAEKSFAGGPKTEGHGQSSAGGPKTEGHGQSSAAALGAGAAGSSSAYNTTVPSAPQTANPSSGLGNYASGSGYDSYKPGSGTSNEAKQFASGTGATGASGLSSQANDFAGQAKNASQSYEGKLPGDLKSKGGLDDVKGVSSNSTNQIPSDVKDKLSNADIGGIVGGAGASGFAGGYAGADSKSAPVRNSGIYGTDGSQYASKGASSSNDKYSSSDATKGSSSYGSSGYGASSGQGQYNGYQTSGRDGYSSSAAAGAAGGVTGVSDIGSVSRSTNDYGHKESSNTGFTKSNGASGFEKTINGPAASAGGAYSGSDPESSTIKRDTNTNVVPGAPQQIEVTKAALLVIIAFLIGWKFF